MNPDYEIVYRDPERVPLSQSDCRHYDLEKEYACRESAVSRCESCNETYCEGHLEDHPCHRAAIENVLLSGLKRAFAETPAIARIAQDEFVADVRRLSYFDFEL